MMMMMMMMVVAFSSLARVLGEGHAFPACFFFLSFFFWKWRSARAHRFHFFFLNHVQSTVAKRARMTVAECLLTRCVWARFPTGFPHCLDSTVSPLRNSWVKAVCVCLGVTCYLHFWQNGRGLLRATAVTRNGTDTPRRSCRDSNSQVFDHEFSTLWTSYPCSPHK